METRGRILEATREVLADVGPAEVTLKAITDRAAVGAGSFYNLFDSKEAAILEVVRDAIGAVDPDPSGRGEETVDDLVHAFVTFFVDPRTSVAARIYLQFAFAGGMTDEAMARRLQRHHVARCDRFAAALRNEHDDLDEEAARAHADRLLAALMGAAMIWLLDRRRDLPALAAALLGDLRPEG
jgi:AcrR family transcriptional regulator